MSVRGQAISAWCRESSKGTTKYEIVLWQNGELSCNCPGWLFPKGRERECKHTRELKYTASAILSGKEKRVFEKDDIPIFSVDRKEVKTERRGRMIR